MIFRRPTTRPRRRFQCGRAAWLAAGVAVALAGPAAAHRSGLQNPPAVDSLSIPSLTHGQMTVIARHLGSIRALADRQFPTDPTMRRLQGFLNLQASVCLWGLVPGAIVDEESPFNECSHSYLAAARMLLAHLQTMPGANRDAVNRLVQQIDAEMYENGASFTLCRYSSEPFNTGEVITPHWELLPAHAPSLLTFAAPPLLGFGLLTGALVARRRSGAKEQTGRA